MPNATNQKVKIGIIENCTSSMIHVPKYHLYAQGLEIRL